MLPLRDPVAFGERLAALGAAVYVAQPFKPKASQRGAMSAGTRDAASALAEAEGWDSREYARAFRELRSALPHLHEGRSGFMPA
jgi:hypothetical protein